MQGQSALTIDKERRIAAAISVGMRIASSTLGGRGYRFFHFDANAGCGVNDEALPGESVPGSPIVFWRAAAECLRGLKPEPWFCDSNREFILSLRDRLSVDETMAKLSVIQEDDNESALKCFAERIRQSGERTCYALGSVIVDTNGYFYRNRDGVGAPIQTLPEFLLEFPRIDIILNMNMRTYRLMREREKLGQVFPGLRSPANVLSGLNKKHWLVSRAGRGQSRFLLAIGRNTPTGDHKALGLYGLDTEIGRGIIGAAENPRQDDFLSDLQDVSGIPLSPSVPRHQDSRDAPRKMALPMRKTGDRGSSHQISSMGDIRQSEESLSNLSSLPLFGAWKK